MTRPTIPDSFPVADNATADEPREPAPPRTGRSLLRAVRPQIEIKSALLGAGGVVTLLFVTLFWALGSAEAAPQTTYIGCGVYNGTEEACGVGVPIDSVTMHTDPESLGGTCDGNWSYVPGHHHITVRDGCSALFAIRYDSAAEPVPDPLPSGQFSGGTDYIDCSSSPGGTTDCGVGLAVGFVRPLFYDDEECRGNLKWRSGWHHFEIRNGCSGTFVVWPREPRGTPQPAPDSIKEVSCGSDDYVYTSCDPDVGRFIRIVDVEQQSNSPCDGRWNEEGGRIHVWAGCRAIFHVEYGGDPGGEPTTKTDHYKTEIIECVSTGSPVSCDAGVTDVWAIFDITGQGAAGLCPSSDSWDHAGAVITVTNCNGRFVVYYSGDKIEPVEPVEPPGCNGRGPALRSSAITDDCEDLAYQQVFCDDSSGDVRGTFCDPGLAYWSRVELAERTSVGPCVGHWSIKNGRLHVVNGCSGWFTFYTQNAADLGCDTSHIWPAPADAGAVVTQEPGQSFSHYDVWNFHGRDLGLVQGHDIYATCPGTVVFAGAAANPSTAEVRCGGSLGDRCVVAPEGQRALLAQLVRKSSSAPCDNYAAAGRGVWVGGDCEGVFLVHYGPDHSGWGNTVVVRDDATGSCWLYAHLASVDVFVGEGVTKRTVLGGSGNTGNSSGPHLHMSRHGCSPNAGTQVGHTAAWTLDGHTDTMTELEGQVFRLMRRDNDPATPDEYVSHYRVVNGVPDRISTNCGVVGRVIYEDRWSLDWWVATGTQACDGDRRVAPPDEPTLASLEGSVVKVQGNVRGEPAMLVRGGRLLLIGTAADYWDCVAQYGDDVTLLDNAYVEAQGWPTDWSGTTDRCSDDASTPPDPPDPGPSPGPGEPSLSDLEGQVVKLRGNPRGEPAMFVRDGQLLHIGTAADYWDCMTLSGQSDAVFVDDSYVAAVGWPVDWSGTTARCAAGNPSTPPPSAGPSIDSLHNTIVKIRGNSRGEPAMLVWNGDLLHIGTAADYWDCYAQTGEQVSFVDNAYVEAQGWPIDWSGTTDRCA
ncbi:MAG: DUF3011 domain-containing protein [Actinomycetota bacterium]